MSNITDNLERQEWRVDGNLHRLDGPAIFEPDNAEEWWQNGLRHREDGPAIIAPILDSYQWWQNGLLHRLDGPAVMTERKNGGSKES